MPHKDSDARRAYMRAYKRRKRDRMRELNKVYDASKHANDRAASYGVTGRIDTATARRVLEHSRCFYCGSTTRIGIDHKIPLHAGGPNAEHNLVACCHSCNASKWRTDRPWRWSREYDRCIDCARADRLHAAHGLCVKCHRRRRTLQDKIRQAAA